METEAERDKGRETTLPETVPVYTCGPGIILNGVLTFSEMSLFGQSVIWSPWEQPGPGPIATVTIDIAPSRTGQETHFPFSLSWGSRVCMQAHTRSHIHTHTAFFQGSLDGGERELVVPRHPPAPLPRKLASKSHWLQLHILVGPEMLQGTPVGLNDLRSPGDYPRPWQGEVEGGMRGPFQRKAL